MGQQGLLAICTVYKVFCVVQHPRRATFLWGQKSKWFYKSWVGMVSALVPHFFAIKFTDFCPKNRWLCAWCQQSCGSHRLASLHWSLAKFCNSKMSEAHCKVWHFSRALSSVAKHFICSSHCHWSSSYSLDRIPIVSCEDWFKRGQQRLAQLQGVVFGALKCFIWHQFWEIFHSNS